jgi:hypothetical protein
MDAETDDSEGGKNWATAIIVESPFVLLAIIGFFIPIYYNLGMTPLQGVLISVPYLSILGAYSPLMSDYRYHYENYRSKSDRGGIVGDALTLGFVAAALTIAYGFLWTRVPAPRTLQWDFVLILVGGLTIPWVSNEFFIRWKMADRHSKSS